MKRKIKLIFLVLCAVVAAVLGFAACTPEETPTAITYTVTYARGADDATGTIPGQETYEEGDEVVLKSATTFSREGYTFINWSDGTSTYAAGATYTMPAHNVTFTAQWQKNTTPGGGDEPSGEEDVPVLTELSSDFYDASNWEYMTNNNGASLDGGDIPYSLSDGSIKFHRENQAIDIGDFTNSTVSFMLKGTNDWNIWFNSSTKDNANNSSYRLVYGYGELRLTLSSAPEQAAARIVNTTYEKGQWNRFDIAFSTEKNADGQTVTAIKVYVNGVRADLTAGDYTAPAVSVADNVLMHTRPAMFTTGTYMVVKVWDADDYVQLKPVANADVEDVPIVAAIGASITEGAGAGNFYTESYPAQLQNALKGEYNIVNFGKSGRTVRTDTGSDTDGTPVPWLENLQWEGVKAIVPDIAIINMGTNDSKTSNNPPTTIENFTEAFNHLLDELLKVNPDMRIIICTVPYAYSGIYDINNDNIANIIAPVQRAIAEERDMELVDLYEITQNKSLLFGDGVHPGTRGYAMFAEIFSKVLIEGADAALTDEFLSDINERYNDIEYEINDIAATISEENGQIKLSLSGNIVIEDASNIRLVVETGNAGDDVRSVPVTLDSNGDFSVSMRIDDLNGSHWYNTHLYLNEDYYYLVMLDETNLTSGQSFMTDSSIVTVHTWQSGGEDVFSFQVVAYENNYSVAFDEGYLVVTATVTDTDTLYFALIDGDDVVSVQATLEEGVFTASIGLDDLTAGNGNWYFLNVSTDGTTWQQIAKYEGFDASAEHFSGSRRYYYAGNTSVIAVVYETYYLTLTSATIGVEGEAINLNISGTTTNQELWFYIGTSGDLSNLQSVTIVGDGSFTVSANLAALAYASGYEVRFYLSQDGTGGYFTLKIPEVTLAEGGAVSVGTVLYTQDVKVTISTTASWNPFNFTVDVYDVAAPVAAVTEVKFEDGNLVVSGTVKNAVEDTTIAISLVNGDNVVAQNAAISEGTFSASISLDLLTANAGEWYRLNMSVNGGANNVVPYYSEFDTTQNYMYGTRRYYFTTEWSNTDFALVYQNYTYGITNAEITDVEGKATLIIEGILADSSVEAANIKLILNKTSGETVTITVDNLATAAGTFRFVYDISNLEFDQPYFLRLYNGETKIDDINSRWAADILFDEVEIGTDAVYYFYRNSLTAYYTLGVVREDTSVPAPVVAVTEVKFENGNLVVSGTVENVTDLAIALIDNDDVVSVDAVIEGNTFTATINLSLLTAANGNWYFLNTSVNDGEWQQVAQYQGFDSSADHVSGSRRYYYATNQSIAVVYEKYYLTITSATIAEEDGAINLTVSGTTTNDTLVFFIGDGTGHDFTQQVTLDNGTFTVIYDLASLPLGAGWFGVRFYISEEDTDYYTVKIPEVQTADGQPLATNMIFYGTDKQISVTTWAADWQPLSLIVAEYSAPVPEEPSVNAVFAGFEDGNFIFSGVAKNVQTLTVYLYNNTENVDTYSAVAELGEDGAFTVKIGLAQLALADGNWYRVRVSIDGGEIIQLVDDDFAKPSQQYTYGARTYKFEGNLAISYKTHSYAYSITNLGILDKEGVATLVIEGTYTGDIAAENIKLCLDKTSATTDRQFIDNLSSDKGTFKFEVDISQLNVSDTTEQYGEHGYFLRLYNGTGTKIADINSTWFSDLQFEDVTIGNFTYYFYRNNASNWYTLGVVRFENQTV